MIVSYKKIFYTILLVIFSLSAIFYTAFSLYRIIITIAPDFSIYYYSTLDLLRSINPYTDRTLFTVYNYPTASNVFFLPFLYFSYPVAQGLFVYFSFASLCGSIYCSIKILWKKFSIRIFFLILSFSAFSFPIKFTYGMGQSNLIGYFFLIWGYLLFTRNLKIKSGILIAIAILLKPILAFMLLFFLLKKQWKLLFTSWCVFGVTNIVALYYFPKATIFYYSGILPHLFSSAGKEVYYNQGFLGFVSRLTDNLTLRSTISTLFIVMIIILLILLSFYNQKKQTILFALFLATLPMIDTLSWQHHFVFLIFPFLVLFQIFIVKKKRVSLFLLILSYILISFNIKSPNTLLRMPYSLLLSHVFYGTVIVFMLNFFQTDRFNFLRGRTRDR